MDAPLSLKPVSGVHAVVLAAGAASRFGGGKLLAQLDGKPLIEHTLGALEASPVDGTVVVIGEEEEVMRGVCEPYGVHVVHNPDRGQGQSTSVRAGLGALRADASGMEESGTEARAAIVLLGDQPLVGASVVGRLVAAFEGGAKVAVATYGGEMRNPVLFSRDVWELLKEELEGDVGARPFLWRHPELVVRVPCEAVGDPADVDTREELRLLEEKMRGGRHTYKIG